MEDNDVSKTLMGEDEGKHAEAFLLSIIENIPDMIFLKDAQELRFIRFNKAAEKLLGLSREELIGKSDHDFFPKEEADFFTTKDREVLKRKELIDIPEEVIQTKEGKRILHTKKIPILDSRDRPLYLLGISEDITERKKDEDKIKDLNYKLATKINQLEDVNRELEAFSYSVSHDLRAPLRGINGLSQAIMEDYYDCLDDVGKDYLERLSDEAHKMGKLIDDILALSRITRKEITVKEVNLSDLLKKIIGSIQRDDPDRKIKFKIQEDVKAIGDPDILKVALKNLLMNSWKFTSRNKNAEIEFGAFTSNGEQVYFIKDNGVGFDMKYVDKIFGVFQRLHSDKDFPGTGVGLATVQRIISRHHGIIWAESEIGSGATFYFKLNAKNEEDSDEG